MPYTSHKNEPLIYNYLTTTMGLNKAAACGVLANIYHESGFNHDQNNGQGVWDVNGYSYGICQWHDKQGSGGRFTNLKKYCSSNGLNYRTLSGQLAYLNYELGKSYSAVLNILKSCSNDSNGAYQTAAQWCARFEIPAGYGYWSNGKLTLGSTSIKRGDFAKSTIYPAYSNDVSVNVNGNSIVSTAKSLIGKPYKSGSDGPNSFTSSTFVYYCYKENGVDIPKEALNQAELGQGKYVMSNFHPGDIMFFSGEGDNRRGQSIVASGISTGVGHKFIGCMGYTDYNEVKEIDAETEELWKEKFVGAVRILNGATGTNTGTSYNGYVSNSPTYSLTDMAGTSIPLSATDSYSDNLKSALSVLAERGETYSSIINLRTGEEFKFYTNENVSENFPVTYSSPGNILGRSVPVLGYDSTGARTIAINLHLFAGAPYRPDLNVSSDVDYVEVLHKDLDLLKSFEYPDYSTYIVIPPPIVLLSIGSTLKIRGVLQGLSIEYNRPFDARNRAMSANISFTITQVSENPPDAYDIKNRTNNSY